MTQGEHTPRDAAVPGGVAVKARSLVLGAGLGALVGWPAGLLQDRLVHMVPELRGPQPAGQPAGSASPDGVQSSTAEEPVKRRVPEKAVDSTAAAIERLEASLRRRQDARQQEQQQAAEAQATKQSEPRKGWW